MPGIFLASHTAPGSFAVRAAIRNITPPMRIHPLLRSLAVLTWLLLGVAELKAQNLQPGADQKWRHLQSEHFELYSRNPEGESRRLLYNLELVHAIFFETYGFAKIRTLPITVYFFSRDKHFEAYKPEVYRKLENIGTFYHPEPDRGIMTVAPLPDYETAQKFAFGSYTHHLFRLTGEAPPLWYGYGMSGIFRNLVINKSTLEIGRPDPHQVSRLQTANLMPVEAMFATDQESRSFESDRTNSLFHDESWALLHYLYFGAHKLSREGIIDFVGHAMRNSRSFDAEVTQRMFENKVGITYQKLNKELVGYFRTGRYGYSTRPLPAVPPAKSFIMRSVPLEEINLRLAELAMRVNRSALGKLLLLHAVDKGPDTARIQEALGADAAREGDWDRAAELWDRALEAGSTNPAVMHELAQHEGRKRFQRFDLFYRLPDDAAEKLRNLLGKSIVATPMQAAAYEMLAWVEATSRDPRIANVNLVQNNFSRLKEKQRTMLALAVVRMRLGDKAGAADILNQLDKTGPDDWVQYGIEHTRAALEERPVDRTKLPAPGQISGPVRAPGPPKVIKLQP
jgi:tetratricopeptide (TPR) repeat protein